MTPEHHLALPEQATGTGVLVLSGSSGRVERSRCDLLARHGAVALSPRWFGGPGQPPGVCEVPVESLRSLLDVLAERSERVAVLGVSKGAEAALLLAAYDDRVAAVVALAPTDVVWANVGPGLDGRDRPQRSCWTWGGVPLPFVPYDDAVEPEGEPPAYRGVYAASRVAAPSDVVEAARVPVCDAEVLLVAGGDDRMWPSVPHAESLVAAREAAGRPTTLVTRADAGHRTVLPGEEPPPPSRVAAHGGSPTADAALGSEAWPALVRLLDLAP